MLRPRNRGLSVPSVLTLFGLLCGADQTVAAQFSFQFASPIQLGALLDGAGVGDFVMEPLFLGTEFDKTIRAGTIVGSPNALIFPEISAFGQVIVPEVRADTRTGARLEANITGRAGLELNAGLSLGGLETDAVFNYSPRLVVPDVIRSGQFFSLRGSAGLDTAGAFGVEHIDLPSASFSADVIFDVNAAGKVDYGFVGIVPYNSLPFDWNVVPQPTDDDGNWTLFGVGVDLDNTNDFATLTVAGQAIGINPGDNDTVFGYDISLDAPGAQPHDPPLFNRDIGRIEIVKPTLGDTMFVDTSLTSDRGIGYTIDANILRLGVDIDGIASTLAAGASYTDFSKIIGQPDSDINGSIDGTILDLKYGPELGYKYESSIDARFDVTLKFSEDVAVILPDGTVDITSTVSGSWNDLPEIAVLGSNAVDVEVTFERYEARRTDRGALTIGDYLEFQALALSANLNIGPFSVELAGIGPAIHARTSVLGDLLGEIEVDLFENNDIFLVEAAINETGSFTLQAAPDQLLYLPATTSDLDNLSSWRVLGTATAPASFVGNTLVIGLGDASASSVDDLLPTTVVDNTSSLQQITAGELQILDGSSLSFGPGAQRVWTLDRIQNDGTYSSLGGPTTFSAGPTGILRIEGNGSISVKAPASRIEAAVLINGEGHELTFTIGELDVTQTINNAGILNVGALTSTVTLTGEFRNSGEFHVSNSATIQSSGGIVNDGLIRVASQIGTAELVFPGGHLGSPTGKGVYAAGQGGTLRTQAVVVEPGEEMLFHAESGGVVNLTNGFSVPGTANFLIDEGGTLILGGVDVFGQGKMDIVNRGLLLVAAGSNTISDPGGGGTVVPVNLDNREGIVRIVADARMGFSATIEDYAGGGATFDAGEWQIIGNPALFDSRNPFSAGGEDIAQLTINIIGITAADNFLGEVVFDDEPTYNIEDFDTTLAINAAKVTLSGAAYFPYFNTIRENRGEINFREGLRFSTDGNLLNSGVINVENGAKLTVNGDLLIHGGGLHIDGRSGLEADDAATLILDHAAHAVEVVGGSLTFGPDAELGSLVGVTGNYYLQGRWTIRESVEVDPDTGVETVHGATVDLGRVDEVFRIVFADMVLDGANVQFDAIHGLSVVQFSSLEVLGGFELRVDNDWGTPLQPGGPRSNGMLVFLNSSVLVDDGGKLFLDQLTASSAITVGSEGYLSASDFVFVDSVDGLLRVDGVLEAGRVEIADTDINNQTTPGPAMLLGTGQIVGNVAVDGGILAPGNDADGLEIYGDLTLSETATAVFELGAETHSRLAVDAATLGGTLEVTLLGGFAPALGNSFTVLTFGSLSGDFSSYSGLDVGGHLSLRPSFTPTSLLLTARPTIDGDINLDGTVNIFDINALSAHWGTAGPQGDANGDGIVNIFDINLISSNWGATGATAVPEPSTLLMLLMAAAAACLSRRRTA
jgi:PEP-CTERM motif